MKTIFYALATTFLMSASLVIGQAVIEPKGVSPESVDRDPNFDKVVLLMHADSDFSDVKGHPMTPNEHVSISSTMKMFGAGSMMFVAPGGAVTTPASPDWDFGTGDFTIEMRVRFTSREDTAYQYLFDIGANGSMIRIEPSAGEVLVFASGEDVINAKKTAPFLPDTWYHLALKRVGNTFSFWRDGKSILSGSSDKPFGAANLVLTIGQNGDGSNSFFGHMDEVRFTKAARDAAIILGGAYPDR